MKSKARLFSMCELSPHPSVIPEKNLKFPKGQWEVTLSATNRIKLRHWYPKITRLKVSQYGLFAIVFPARTFLKAVLNECFNIKAYKVCYRLQSGRICLQSMYKHWIKIFSCLRANDIQGSHPKQNLQEAGSLHSVSAQSIRVCASFYRSAPSPWVLRSECKEVQQSWCLIQLTR